LRHREFIRPVCRRIVSRSLKTTRRLQMRSLQKAGEKTVSETPKPRAALMERLNRLSSQHRRDADVAAVKTVQSGGKER